MANGRAARLFGGVPGFSPERSIAHRIPTRVEAAVRGLGLSYVAHGKGELVLRREPEFDFTQSDEAISRLIGDALNTIEPAVAEVLKSKYSRIKLK